MGSGWEDVSLEVGPCDDLSNSNVVADGFVCLPPSPCLVAPAVHTRGAIFAIALIQRLTRLGVCTLSTTINLLGTFDTLADGKDKFTLPFSDASAHTPNSVVSPSHMQTPQVPLVHRVMYPHASLPLQWGPQGAIVLFH